MKQIQSLLSNTTSVSQIPVIQEFNERATPITISEARKISPGTIRILDEVLQNLNRRGLILPTYKLPAIYFCRHEDYRKHLNEATQESTAPKNESRGFASVEATKHVIYIDFEYVNNLLSERGKNDAAVIAALTEEIIHSMTRRVDGDKFNLGYVNVGFKPEPDVTPAFYKWEMLGESEVERDYSVEIFREDPREIVATENLTRLAALLASNLGTHIVFELDNGTETPDVKMIFSKAGLEAAYKNYTKQSLYYNLILSLRSGDLNTINTLVLNPIRPFNTIPSIKLFIECLERYVYNRNFNINYYTPKEG